MLRRAVPITLLRKQSGAALLVMILFLVLGGSYALLRGLNKASSQAYRDEQTAKALAEAKDALVGRAVGGKILSNSTNCSPNCPRPGDLPCPDLDNDGDAETSCNTPSKRLGRLPWKTLGIEDLRDGSGERLWYAVSDNFKNNTRTYCSTGSEPGCLNSDTAGTITVFKSDNTIENDIINGTGAIAVVLAPGSALTRIDNIVQERKENNICFTTTDPLCDVKNYLDMSATEDNSDLQDNTTNGFIDGYIRDENNLIIVNDKLTTISYNEVMPFIEKRLLGEIYNCLRDYSLSTGANNRYPWAAPVSAAPPNYKGVQSTRFGRLPDQPFIVSVPGPASVSMPTSWPTTCQITNNNWWPNWKEHVFYGVSEAYQPAITPPIGCTTNPNTCFTIKLNATVLENKQFIVFLARKRLLTVNNGQPRNSVANKNDILNYLENQTPPNSFTISVDNTNANDLIRFYPE